MISSDINLDIARVQQDYGRPYMARPQVYVMASDATYRAGQTSILGIGPMFVGSMGNEFETAGVYYAKKVAIDRARVSDQRPFLTGRHELTHMMIDEIAGGAAIPAWLNEGSAVLEETTVPGSLWLATRDRAWTVSMVATGQLFTLDQLSSQLVWNSRTGVPSQYQYAEAEETVQLLRNEAGIAGEVQILSFQGSGSTYDDAYAAVTGRTSASFALAMPVRLRASQPVPGIAFAPDSVAGPGANGPTFVLYGYAPNSFVNVGINGASTGFFSNRFQQIDQYGAYWSRLGTAWPADTYTFTVTAFAAPTVIGTYLKTP